MILGDNIFSGSDFQTVLKQTDQNETGAVIFASQVACPERYGVVTFDEYNNILSIMEKPEQAVSKWAVTGLYFFDRSVVEKAKTLNFSKRGELEITDLNNLYLKDHELTVCCLPSGFVWLDAGVPDSLLEAAQYICSVQKRQGIVVGAPEISAYTQGWIDKIQLERLIHALLPSQYGRLLAGCL